jgi:hypothetical protein
MKKTALVLASALVMALTLCRQPATGFAATLPGPAATATVSALNSAGTAIDTTFVANQITIKTVSTTTASLYVVGYTLNPPTTEVILLGRALAGTGEDQELTLTLGKKKFVSDEWREIIQPSGIVYIYSYITNYDPS